MHGASATGLTRTVPTTVSCDLSNSPCQEAEKGLGGSFFWRWEWRSQETEVTYLRSHR